MYVPGDGYELLRFVCVCVWGGGGGGEVGICKIVLQSSPQAQLFFLN